MTLTDLERPAQDVANSNVKAATGNGARAGGAVLLLLGFVIVRLLWQGRVNVYVRPAMTIPLAIAAGLIAALGVFGLIRRSAPLATGHDADHGHDHGRLPRTCWLLVVPVIVLTLIAPGALTASASPTQAPTQVPFHAAGLHPDVSGDIDIKLRDLLGWATEDPKKRLEHRQLRLIGVAASVTEGGRLVRLTRFTITCCAADASPFSAEVSLPADSYVPTRGSWIEITGSWDGHLTSDGWPHIDGATVQSISQPAEPYEL